MKKRTGLIMLGIIVLIVLSLLSFESESVDTWNSNGQILTLDDRYLEIDEVKAEFVAGSNLDGVRTTMTFQDADCFYDLTIMENGDAILRTELGALCPYYDLQLEKVK